MERFEELITPREIKERIKLSEKARENVAKIRRDIDNILEGKDNRKIFIIGPCSIHDYEEALEYAKMLKGVSDKIGDKILVLMRVYLEKPRSSVGWKGFVNDPNLNETYDIEKGLIEGRRLLLEINELGLGVATEILDHLVYPYLTDMISWAAVGARTVESPTHRQIVSELLMPVGFKNSTSGNIEHAINAIISAGNEHTFLGIDEEGKVSKITTSGNPSCHLILRGGDSGPNFEEDFVKEAQERLREAGLPDNVMIDCSHGNSGKDYRKQPEVVRNVIGQMKTNSKIIGLMIESNTDEGNQKIDFPLRKGVSVTDACLGWKPTEELLIESFENL